MRRTHSRLSMLKLATLPLVGLVVAVGLAAWLLWSPLGGSPAAQATGPHITVTKECSLSAEVFTFTFTITNDGDIPLVRWIAKDSTLGNMVWQFPETLAVGQTETVTFTKPQLPWDNLCNWAEVAYRNPENYLEIAKVRPECCVEVTPPPPGSLTLTKFKEVGPFTVPTLVCFRLDPVDPVGDEQCKAPDAGGNATFTWTNLTPGDYSIVETKEVCTVKGVEEDPCTRYALLDPIPVTMPDPPQAIVIPPSGKIENLLQPGEICFEKRNPDESLWSGGQEDVTFKVTGVTDPSYPEQVHLIASEGNPICKPVPEGIYKICETPPPDHTVSPSECQTVEALSGQLATVTVTFVNTPEDGGEGCTPGFWKVEQHLVHWGPTGFSPADPFEVVFGTAPEPFPTSKLRVPDPSLLEVLWVRGGGINALSRHAVAALLNAAHPDVSYGLSPAEVIAAYQAAVASGDPAVITAQKDIFEGLNEAGCPVN